MMGACSGDCLRCGKCAKHSLPVLESFRDSARSFAPREGLGIAADIGTTTVVLALLRLDSGEILSRHSFVNPQRTYGADVISRIGAASGGQAEALRRCIVDALCVGVRALLDASGADGETLRDMVVAGNTAMIHILCGFDCAPLGTAPFRPAVPADAAVLPGGGLPGFSCPLRIVPWCAAFVGGDITAGLVHILPEGKDCFLLIDLGTNGELALYDHGRLLLTATAAGPAFEGGQQKGGASAVLGQLARLLREGHLDESGCLSPAAPPPLNQMDIRALQLAKSAVRSGVEILLETAGLCYDAPEAVMLAGGIGQAVDPDAAIEIGLLPAALRPKLRAAGNASLGGAVRLLLCPGDMDTARRLAASAEELNLSAHKRFSECFVEYMGF